MLFIIAMAMSLFGCGKGLGKVDQGRVIEFDREKRTVTFIRDMTAEPGNPRYTHLPPVTYELPKDPHETGQEPKAGYRMQLDTKKKQITLYVPAAKGFKTIEYKLIAQKESVLKDDPLVVDRDTNKPRKFPVIDRAKKTITIYSGRQKMLTTFTVPDRYFALPEKTWDAGDEVRVYYKEEGEALRFMNVSRTDIFKK
jgi:hypothetical protein